MRKDGLFFVMGRFLVAVLVIGALAVGAPGVWGCGGSGGSGDDGASDDDDNDDDSGGGTIYPGGQPDSTTVTFESSTLATVGALALPDVVAGLAVKTQEEGETVGTCTIVVPGASGGNFEGLCFTPINITGVASTVSVGMDQDTSMEGPARLLGSTVGTISLDRYGELEVSPFDFADPVGMPSNSNVADFDERTYDLLRVDLAYMDVKIEVARPGDTFEYWTIRWAFITNPVSDAVFDNNSTIDQCVDEFYGASIEENGLLVGLKDFQAGDLLLCQKSTADAECVEDDFQWFDTQTDTFTGTRPNNPLQHAWVDVPERECEQDGEGYSIQLGSYDFFATINNPFTLSSEYEQCLQIYTDGDENTGNTLDVTMDFSIADAVFSNTFDDEVDLAAASDAAIFESLEFTQIFVRSRQPDPTAITDDLSANMTVNVTVSVTDDEALSCSSLDDIDARLVGDADNPCTPDAEVDIGCEHEACTGFNAVDEAGGNIWSETESGGCTEFCTIQTCPEYNGTFKAIHCVPECDEDGGGGDDEGQGDNEGEGPDGEPESCEECLTACEEQDLAEPGETCDEACASEFPDLCP